MDFYDSLLTPTPKQREVARIALCLSIGDCLDLAREIRDISKTEAELKEEVKELADKLSALYDRAKSGQYT